ncbi:PepSY domain-containing protein [Brevibacterium sp. JNUCC-42]|nr:PepSY domain-containing protein [Brevibacterium sp. JNUCC-42]
MNFKIITPDLKERNSSIVTSNKDLSEIAKSTFEKYMDTRATELQLTKVEKTGFVQTYRFEKSYQGIPVIRGYAVTIDAEKEKVIGINIAYRVTESAPFPDKAQAMTPDAAATIYLKERPLSLVYVMLQDTKQQIVTPHLVYQVYYHDTPRLYVDAVTGEIVR